MLNYNMLNYNILPNPYYIILIYSKIQCVVEMSIYRNLSMFVFV